MPIEYIDGIQFYNAFTAGSKAVFLQTDLLNRINVFPVADGDTGTNLSMTMKSIIAISEHSPSIKQTLASLAESAISNAQGNSGIIFAQYLLGLNQELTDKNKIDVKEFADSAHKAVKYVYNALLNPVEGTILTVIKDWAESLKHHSEKTSDFTNLITLTLVDARKSLLNTPKQLQVLADAGVLDAGAQGFVNFIEGIYDYIKSGCKHKESKELILNQNIMQNDNSPSHSYQELPEFRYCTESIIKNCKLSIESLKHKYKSYGDSLIIAGTNKIIHLHIHTNNPDHLFYELYKEAEISQIKVDDMISRNNIVSNKKHSIGLMTDTAADLPQNLIEEHQIIQVPFVIRFKNNQFLDKFTIQPEFFYKLLKQTKIVPTSSLPALSELESAMSFLETQYNKSICLHIASPLSATYQTSYKLSEKHPGITVIDSKHLSVSEGLLLLRIAKAIEEDMEYDEIIDKINEWRSKTFIYTDISTLKYMVRSGRVTPLKGFIAKLINLKPIVSVDEKGRGIAYGKSFSRKSNMEKIVKIICDLHAKYEIWNYAIVHSDAETRANQFAEKLSILTGKPPAYIMPLSPVVGVHNGIGAVAVGISVK